MKGFISIVSAFVCFWFVSAASTGPAAGTTLFQTASTAAPAYPAGATHPIIDRNAPKKLAVVSAGTSLTVRMGQPVGTKAMKQGDLFTGTLAAPVLIDGKTILPRGSKIEGRVIRSHRGLGPAGKPELALKLTHIAAQHRFLPVSSNQYSIMPGRENRLKGLEKGKSLALKNILVTESDILIRPGARLVFFLTNPLAVGIP